MSPTFRPICPECGKDFADNRARGSHRKFMHQVAGSARTVQQFSGVRRAPRRGVKPKPRLLLRAEKRWQRRWDQYTWAVRTHELPFEKSSKLSVWKKAREAGALIHRLRAIEDRLWEKERA